MAQPVKKTIVGFPDVKWAEGSTSTLVLSPCHVPGCVRGTFLTYYVCDSHLRSELGLDVRPSLCARGLGLFAVRAFDKDEFICTFGGEKLTLQELDERHGAQNTAQYAVQSADSHVVFDEEYARSPCAYANDSIDAMSLYHMVLVDKMGWDEAYTKCCVNHPACARVVPTDDGRICLLATRRLPPGTEITWHYGSQYWRGINVMQEFIK